MGHGKLRDLVAARVRACFCHVIRGGPYRFFTNLSGLSQGWFAKLCLSWGRLRSFNRFHREERTESYALSPFPMTLMVLATTCLVACAFYSYVLCQWMPDTKGKRTTRFSIDRPGGGAKEKNRPYIMGSRKWPM